LSRRVLVVDDDPRLLHIVAMYLGIEGYDVVIAPDGQSGLAEIAKQPPDLIILDIMMPGLDGIETCRRIRAEPATAEIPVLMFSALSGDDDNHLITKPFNLVGLGSVVKSFFAPDSPVAV
jgi:DNA-binding response OmpR family regulator